jgi:hypothetical protein
MLQRKNPKIKYQAPKKKSKNQISGSKENLAIWQANVLPNEQTLRRNQLQTIGWFCGILVKKRGIRQQVNWYQDMH